MSRVQPATVALPQWEVAVPQRVIRRLAAIVALDVVGYSRLTGLDEEGTLARLKILRDAIIEPAIADAHGRIVKTMGDGLLIEFPSSVDAVRCAIAIQSGMATRSSDTEADRRVELRIGVHVGDVVVDDTDLLGDGVNIAARLEGVAPAGGVSISEDVWRQVDGKVPTTFSDMGEVVLKNISRPVRVYRADNLGKESTDQPPSHAMTREDLPTIAVMPFSNLSGDPEQEFFADGLAEDIITTLSKLSGLRVIARNSSFIYKGRVADVRDVARQLGVRHVLEGSVRRSGSRIRISVQLIDGRSGSPVWAERYDRTIEDIFAVQDEITLVLATELQVSLTEGEQARLQYTTTSNVEAWTQWVQGLSYYRQAVTKENCGRALPHWEKALALDPGSAALNGMLGLLHYVDARFGWWDARETALHKARSYADKALELDSESAVAFTTSSLVLLLEGRFDEAAAHARKAVELAPGSADAASFASFVFASAGLPEKAIEYSERATKLSPKYPGYYLGHLGHAYRLAGHFENAIAAFKAYEARNPGFGLVDLVIAYCQSGHLDLAEQTATRLLSRHPDFTIRRWASTQIRHDPTQLEAEKAALRSSGLPPGD
ncbi:MAG: tetratricopeptide repeat protein [Mesorhizobium sp.]|nr:MAG: tetratricopeptide repeat protein [Mesorhizobium sp.]